MLKKGGAARAAPGSLQTLFHPLFCERELSTAGTNGVQNFSLLTETYAASAEPKVQAYFLAGSFLAMED